MSDPFDPEDYEGIQERTRNVPTRQIKAWEQQAKRLAELEAREAARERTAALTEAGIPAEFGALFRDDAPVDALKAAFEKFGGAASSTPSAVQQSLAGHEVAASMASGAQSAGTSDLGAQLDQMKFDARNRVNWKSGSRKENANLNALLAREGISPQVTAQEFHVPGQLAGS